MKQELRTLSADAIRAPFTGWGYRPETFAIRPIEAVTIIAAVPPSRTRIVGRSRVVPAARAPSTPATARPTMVTATISTSLDPWLVASLPRKGTSPPMVKLAADHG